MRISEETTSNCSTLGLENFLSEWQNRYPQRSYSFFPATPETITIYPQALFFSLVTILNFCKSMNLFFYLDSCVDQNPVLQFRLTSDSFLSCSNCSQFQCKCGLANIFSSSLLSTTNQITGLTPLDQILQPCDLRRPKGLLRRGLTTLSSLKLEPWPWSGLVPRS